MSKRNLRGFNFERLEDRRLLAADCCAEVFHCCDALPAETCQVSTMEVEDGVVESAFEEPTVVHSETEIEAENQGAELVESDAILDEVIDELNCETEEESDPANVTEEVAEEVPVKIDVIESIDQEFDRDQCEVETEVEVTAETMVDVETVVDEVVEVEVEVDVDVDVETQEVGDSELRDPVTGTSGYFGEIDEITPTKSMTFTPSESGMVDVVVASSFGDSETRLEITDADGDLIAGTMTEDLSGFQRLTFDVVENETYEISVASDELGQGYFMVTVEFEKATEPVPVDLHANVIGETATLLEGQDGTIAIESELETAEDCDAFRFVAADNGEMVLGMTAASEDHQSNAIVSVFNPGGDLVVSGSTNEEVAIRFDANSGVEYQVLVDSLNDVPTQFSLNGTLFADVVDEADPIDELVNVDDIILDNETNLDDSMDVCDVDLEASEIALVDEVFEGLGNDIVSENESVRNRFGGQFRGPWFRRI